MRPQIVHSKYELPNTFESSLSLWNNIVLIFSVNKSIKLNIVKNKPCFSDSHISCVWEFCCFVLQLVESEEQFQQRLADRLVEETTFTVNVWVPSTMSSWKPLRSAVGRMWSVSTRLATPSATGTVVILTVQSVFNPRMTGDVSALSTSFPSAPALRRGLRCTRPSGGWPRVCLCPWRTRRAGRGSTWWCSSSTWPRSSGISKAFVLF